MKRLLLALPLLALAGCETMMMPAGPNSYYHVDATRDCGGTLSPWIEPTTQLPVRCGPQSLAPY